MSNRTTRHATRGLAFLVVLASPALLGAPDFSVLLGGGSQSATCADAIDPIGWVGGLEWPEYGICLGPGVTGAGTASIGNGARVGPDVVLGDRAVIAPRVRFDGRDAASSALAIGELTAIGRRTTIGADANLGARNAIARAVSAGPRLSTEDDVSVGYAAMLGADVTLRDHARIGNLAELGDDVIVGANAAVGRGATLRDGARAWGDVGPEATIGVGVQVPVDGVVRRGATVGDGTTLGAAASVGRGVQIGANARVGDGAVIRAGATVAANACVPDGARVGRGDSVTDLCENVVVSAFDCALVQAAGGGSGVHTVQPSGPTGPSVPMLCDMDTDGGPWTLAYKRSAGVVRSDIVADYLSGALNPGDASLLHRDGSPADYAGPAVLDWSRWGEARVEVVAGGTVRQWMSFDAVGSTAGDFFSKARVTGSSWTTIVPEHEGSGVYWSISGSPSQHRHWYVNRNWGGCPNDEGWLMVHDQTTSDCSFDTAYSIRYAGGTTVTNLTSGQWLDADALLVWVRPAQPGKTRASARTTCAAHYAAGETQDGAYWVDPDGLGTGAAPFRTFCDMQNGGWTMIYKRSAGVPKDPTTTWGSGAENTSDFGALSRLPRVGDFSTPGITSGWSAWTQARVEVIDDNAVAAQVTFNTAGSTNQDWFASGRVTASTWTDFSAGFNYFGIAGDTANLRRFFIHHSYGGCAVDVGWLIASAANTPCAWEVPYGIKYTKGGVRRNWTTEAANVGTAEALIVFAR